MRLGRLSRRLAGGLALLLALAAAAPAGAWLTLGHRRVGIAAAAAVAGELPPFFVAGAETIGHLAVDPDLFRNRDTPTLRSREEVEHFLDSERLPPGGLPPTAHELLVASAARGLRPAQIGLLPYAVIEGTEKLALCLAEHRRWPDNPHVRAKCLVFAGLLAHYAGDLAQPLHTTIHHDGWALPSGGSPLEGFHVRIDALLERAPFDPAGALAGLSLAPLPDLRAGVLAALEASHALLDRTYRLQPLLGAAEGFAHPEVVAFACERYRAAVELLGRLYLTAWSESERIELPGWLQRESGALEPVGAAP